MPSMTFPKPDSNKDGKESPDPESQPQAASGEEGTCTAATEQLDSTQQEAASESTTTRSENVNGAAHQEAQPQAADGNGAVISSLESSMDFTSPRAVESSDSNQCCRGAPAAAAEAMSADDRLENADILGAATQLLSVCVHLLKAVARDRPPVEDSELLKPPGEGTRLVHAVKEFLINPELLQPEQAAAEIMREVNRPARRRRYPLQQPQETLREYLTWLVCLMIVVIAAIALFIYLGYTSYHMFFDRPHVGQ